MHVHTVFCPRCRTSVRVCTPTPPIHRDGHAPIPDHPRQTCLDFEDACMRGPPGEASSDVRARCPVLGVKAVILGIERAKLGLTPEPRSTTDGPCPSCGMDSVQENVGPTLTVCDLCRGINEDLARQTHPGGEPR